MSDVPGWHLRLIARYPRPLVIAIVTGHCLATRKGHYFVYHALGVGSFTLLPSLIAAIIQILTGDFKNVLSSIGWGLLLFALAHSTFFIPMVFMIYKDTDEALPKRKAKR